MAGGALRQELRDAEALALARAATLGGTDEKLVRTCFFWALHNREKGVYGWRPSNRYRVSRKEWIEQHVFIKDVRGQIIPLRLNEAQRALEAKTVRIERQGRAVRIVILKSRQHGLSTYIIALALWLVLTGEAVSCVIVANNDRLARRQLARARLMLRKLRDREGKPWALKLERDSQGVISIADPIGGSIEVTTAGGRDPGHGETNDLLHMTETSRWANAEEVAKGIEQTAHEVAGNYVFDETTANGNTGYFRDKFYRAWNRDNGIEDDSDSASSEVLGGLGWVSLFVPWFQHESYRWTALREKDELLHEIRDEIEGSLDSEEKVLLKQRYLRRGYGWQTVDYDQLAWRRYAISEKCNGNIETFHEQYPAFVDEAFLSSGNAVFDARAVRLHMSEAEIPERGDFMEDPVAGPERPAFFPSVSGAVEIWERPVPGRQYAMGVDSSSGTRKSDLCVASVIDMETCHQVAVLAGRWEPTEFGRLCAMIGWHYNEAFTGVETFPSLYGLPVYDKMETLGYQSLYVQQSYESLARKASVNRGWATTNRSRPVLIERLRVALKDGTRLRSLGLLQEMLDAELDDREHFAHSAGNRIARKSKNDHIMAHAIALRVRDAAFREGRAEEPPPRLDETERFWKEYLEKHDEPQGDGAEVATWGGDDHERLYDGIG